MMDLQDTQWPVSVLIVIKYKNGSEGRWKQVLHEEHEPIIQALLESMDGAAKSAQQIETAQSEIQKRQMNLDFNDPDAAPWDHCELYAVSCGTDNCPWPDKCPKARQESGNQYRLQKAHPKLTKTKAELKEMDVITERCVEWSTGCIDCEVLHCPWCKPEQPGY